MFTRSHRVRERNLCGHSVEKLHEATQVFIMVDCTGYDCAEVPYGEYGSFEHVLFFSSFSCHFFFLFFVVSEYSKLHFPIQDKG